MNTLRALQIAVIQIFDTAIGQLDHALPLYGDWSVQGFGMLRLYVRNIGRIHIWTEALRYPNVSMIHNHAWDLDSTVICGRLLNTKFCEYHAKSARSNTQLYNKVRLQTGFDSRLLANPELVRLYEYEPQIIPPGDNYYQAADEIHRTDAEEGTVTIMQRKDTKEAGQADVFWPVGSEWGTAQPRGATPEEIRLAIGKAMRWLV